MEKLERLLAEHPFFKDLDPRYIQLIAGCASEVTFKAGEFVFREGDLATHFWLIRQGKVSLEIFAPGRGPIMLETLMDGDVMGWSWIVEPFKKQYDARALDLTRAIVFDAMCIRGKCEEEPKLGYELFKRFSQIIGERLQATRMRLLDLYGAHADA
ncbi:MAG: Crp/Fnr family transcriptional regulator [Candidatus Fraserbacteria bacterium RBG_16_55_9]|uniref:Crp/Fnr family transcriptional regulator n=1 Tax=Fraserbacteria sp. (strain RBG_16_55_9) TaxID=1817864 RepID=A0A1F5V072_FRAXR|nr:MAG: Crp/Fnr family transcriptional regulator [Candidatus Fraserbacteria bacterium RBG_16_55_9]